MSHLVLKNKTRLAICVPRKSTHTRTEAIVSKTMLYSENILIINTYIRVSRNGNYSSGSIFTGTVDWG